MQKTFTIVLVFFMLNFQVQNLWALPQGEQVVAGAADFDRPDVNTLNVNTSEKAIIDYDSFNIGEPETVNFFQPSSDSVVLNRVTGGDASSILGRLNANGKIFLVNRNGVFFGPNSVINAAGFTASVLDIDNQDFLDGNYSFSLHPGSENSSVINQGLIEVASGGTAALLAPHVVNEGLVIANQGKIALVSGEKATLDFEGNGLIKFVVEGDLENALAKNTGTLQAAGGEVLLTARAAEAVIENVVNNEGRIDASSIVNDGGIIRLVSTGGGITANSGTLDASSAGGKGGTIQVLGDKVALFNGSDINASGFSGGGNVLIGGDYRGSNPEILNASRTFIGEETLINANAVENGNGGKVIVWSNDGTQVYGQISARGGVHGGDGGFVETSGGWFDIQSVPDVSAFLGAGGEWLLDPHNLEIVTGNGNTNINSSSPFATTSDTAQLGVDLIITALSGGNVSISTSSGGSQIGNITWTANMDYNTVGTDKTLTLNAYNDITLNGSISQTGTDDSINLVFNADSDNDGGGAIIINNSISTGGGSVTFQDGVYLAANLNTSTSETGRAGGAVSFNGQTLIAKTGGVSITTTGQGNSGDGAITFTGLLDSGNTYTFVNDQTRTWQAAKTNAASGTGASTGDTYLTTVTSALESSIVTSTAGNTQVWLGGNDIAVEGEWRWVTGPEGLENSGAGRLFSNGGSSANGQYTNWNGGEPNNCCGSEDALQGGFGSLGKWNDLPDNSTTLNYVKETNLAPTALTITAGTATVTFSNKVGSNKALGDLNIDSAGNVNVNNTMNVTGNITVTNSGTLTSLAAGDITASGAFTQNGTGTATLAGDITTTTGNINLNRPVTVDTDVAFYGGDNVNVVNNITRSAAGSGTLTLRSNNSVIFSSGADITASTGSLNLIVNADRDANEVGTINLEAGTVITTNGGEVIFSGGNGDTNYLRNTGYAWGTSFGGSLNRGIYILGSEIHSGGGNITLRGHGDDLDAEVNQGVDIVTNSIIDGGSGNITINGVAGNGSAQSNQVGAVVYNNSIVYTTGAGNISITGAASNSGTGQTQRGVVVTTNAIVRAGGTGTISITGTGGSAGSSSDNYGVHLSDNSRIEGGSSGSISIDSVAGNGSPAIFLDNTSQLGEGPLAGTYSGNITMTADTMKLEAPVQTTGTATLLVKTAGRLIDLGSTADTTANTLEISGAELEQFTAGNLVVGSGANGNITVHGISAANSNNISGTVTLNATRDNARVIFNSSASTFNALAVNADDGIDVDVNVTTDTGAMTFNGDSDDAADSFDNIDLAAGLTLMSAGAMSLTASTGGILLSGADSSTVTLDSNGDGAMTLGTITDTNNPNLTVNSEGGITLAGLTNAGTGTYAFTADNDSDGTATFAVNGAVTGSSTLTFSGGGTGTNDDLDLNADITAKVLTIQNFSSVDLAGGVDLTATNGALSANSNVTVINLSGGNGTTNIIDGNGDAPVSLANITDTNNVNLTVNSEGNLTLGDLTNLGSGTYTFTVDNDDDQSLTFNYSGTVTGNSELVFSGSRDNADDYNDRTGALITSQSLTIQRFIDKTGGKITQQGFLDDPDSGEIDFESTEDLTLNATGGTIGLLENPIEVEIGGELTVGAAGSVDGISIVINGTTGDGKINIIGEPPGLVIFNNKIVGGKGSDHLLEQIGTASGPELKDVDLIFKVGDFTVSLLEDPVSIDMAEGILNPAQMSEKNS